MMKKVWFLRHGEAEKNIKDVHGGNGTQLTYNGVREVNRFVDYFKSVLSENIDIAVFGHKVNQVVESCGILSKELETEIIYDERIKGIDLGVAGGLSRSVFLKNYPEEAKSLEGWRLGKVKINQINVTDMEDVEVFSSRIRRFLDDIETMDSSVIVVVCTTSVMIMILNLLLLGNDFNYNDYKNYDISTSDYIHFELDCKKYNLVDTNIKI